MYLLKRENSKVVVRSDTFTFHHVSIKTVSDKKGLQVTIAFTFHHVSIKTTCRDGNN